VKERSRYLCQECGHPSPGWLGRCPECGSWDSLLEERGPRTAPGSRRRSGSVPAAVVAPLLEVPEESLARLASGIPLLDRVLGGGIVQGGTVLLAGEPGIGKSTLLLEVAEALARAGRGVLYVSAEESPRQLRLRAERLGCAHPGLLVAGETSLEAILGAVAERAPEVLVVDSIQAVRSLTLESLPGSVAQVRTCAEGLVTWAKAADCALFLVGHVTKEGHIAGPKSLEHLVDTVLAFEGEAGQDHRLLRASKNRFGPTGEVALFTMHDDGLEPVADPSGVLLAQRRPEAPGSAVAASLHGSRPLLVEVQALVQGSSLPSPRRMSLGLEGQRVALLLAVLERFAGLGFATRDVYLNVVGGLALREPAADLAVAAALVSALSDRPWGAELAFFGEVGLLGEVRPVGQGEARLREVAAHGFRRVVTPRLERVRQTPGVERLEITHVAELARLLSGR
jgi:DNA repair protein RadA/Sms